MHNTFLIETLKLLSPEEIKEFGLFVESEFHNSGKNREEILQLHKYITSFYPELNSDQLQKEVIYPIIFPNTPEFVGKLEKLFGELYKLLKEYLLWINYQSQEAKFHKGLDWVQVLRKRKERLNYESALLGLEKDYIKKVPQAPIHFFQKFQLEVERYEWMSQMNKGRDDLNIINSLSALFAYYESFRLKLLNDLLLQQKMTHFEIPDLINQHLNSGLSTGLQDSNIPALYISDKIYKLLKEETPQHEDFEHLMYDLVKHERDLDSEMLKSYFAHLRNICTIMINGGHLELQMVQFKLYKDNLSRGYLYHEGKLHINVLINITRISILTGQVAWASECIELHKDNMFGDIDTDDYYLINKALCLFEKKDYQQVLHILPPTVSNIMYHLVARRLEIMCYFEIESELLNYKLEAFKVYIWRASEKFLSHHLRDANKAFINLLLQLVSIQKGDRNKLERLEKRILEKKIVAELRWLLSKVRM